MSWLSNPLVLIKCCRSIFSVVINLSDSASGMLCSSITTPYSTYLKITFIIPLLCHFFLHMTSPNRTRDSRLHYKFRHSNYRVTGMVFGGFEILEISSKH